MVNGTADKKRDLKFTSIVFSTEKEERGSRFEIPKKVINYLFYILLIASAIYFVFISDFFIIKEIKVENVKSVEIDDYVKVTLQGKNILFMMPGKYLEQLTEKFPVLEEARIVRGLPSTVRVIVDERDQKFIWCNSTDCFEVDNNGYIFEKTIKSKDEIVLQDLSDIKVNYLDRVVSKQFIDFFMSALEGLEGIGLSIKEAQISQTTFRVDFVTQEGWRVVMDSSSPLDNQVFATKQVVEKNRPDVKEYADVRVEGVVFLK